MLLLANRTAAQYCVMQIVVGLFVQFMPCVVDANHKLKSPTMRHMTTRGDIDALFGRLNVAC